LWGKSWDSTINAKYFSLVDWFLRPFASLRHCQELIAWERQEGHDHCQIFFAGPMVSQIGYEEYVVTIRGFEVRPGTHCGRDGCGCTISTKYFSLVQWFLKRV